MDYQQPKHSLHIHRQWFWFERASASMDHMIWNSVYFHVILFDEHLISEIPVHLQCCVLFIYIYILKGIWMKKKITLTKSWISAYSSISSCLAFPKSFLIGETALCVLVRLFFVWKTYFVQGLTKVEKKNLLYIIIKDKYNWIFRKKTE